MIFSRRTHRPKRQATLALLSCLFLGGLLSGLLSACGLQPVYGTYSSENTASVTAAMAATEITSIPEKSGQDLRNALMDRLYTKGRPADPRYRLRIASVDKTNVGLGISKDASASRAQLRLSATMVLTDAATEAPILTRTLNAVSSYNVLDSHFTTLVSQSEAEINAINEIAEQAVIQLELYFASPKREQTGD